MRYRYSYKIKSYSGNVIRLRSQCLLSERLFNLILIVRHPVQVWVLYNNPSLHIYGWQQAILRPWFSGGQSFILVELLEFRFANMLFVPTAEMCLVEEDIGLIRYLITMK